ncbi:MAG: nucleotide disphospho-sugar-binding domain-containing protein [Planctomycetota bacterium]
MPRALLVTFGSHGDVNPFIGIGNELRRRGWGVTLAANEVFAEQIRAAGLDFEQLGTREQFEELIDRPDVFHPTRGVRMVFDEACRFAGETADFVRDSAGEFNVVAASTLAFGARIAQDGLAGKGDRLRLATVHLAPSIFWSVEDPPEYGRSGPPFRRMPRWLRRFMYGGLDVISDALLRGKLTEACRRHGIRTPRRIFRSWWHSPDRVLAMFPEWYAAPASDWPGVVRCCGFPAGDGGGDATLSEELVAWLDGLDRPPIVATFGTGNAHADTLLRAALAAADRADRIVLALSRFADGNAGSRHRFESYVPLSALLPRVGAIVHHGGIGTTARALRSGTPQVVTPFSFDQWDNARRVEELGCGIAIDQYRRSGRHLVDDLVEAFGVQVSVETRVPVSGFDGVTRAADEIEILVGGGP